MRNQIRMKKISEEKVYDTTAREIITRRYSVPGFLLCLMLLACASPASAQVRDLFNNTNTAAVRNGGAIPPQFLLNVPTRITQVVTYHWNDGRGAMPGNISLRHDASGQLFRFAATGTAGFRGAPNVNWVANVSVNVPAGFYTVLDSDRFTWSNNAQSAGQGFAIVRGFALPPQPLPPIGSPPNPRTAPPTDRGSNNPDACSPLIPVASMPSVAPNLLQQTVSDPIGGADTDDWYCINVTGPNGSQQSRGVTFVLSGFAGNVQLQLLAYDQIRPPFGPPIQPRQLIATAGPQGGAQKSITGGLSPGIYLVRVRWTGAPTNYTLTISTPAR